MEAQPALEHCGWNLHWCLFTRAPVLGAPLLTQALPEASGHRLTWFPNTMHAQPSIPSLSATLPAPGLPTGSAHPWHGRPHSPSFTSSWSTRKEPDWRGWEGSSRLSWSIRYTSDWGGTEAVGSLKRHGGGKAASGVCGQQEMPIISTTLLFLNSHRQPSTVLPTLAVTPAQRSCTLRPIPATAPKEHLFTTAASNMSFNNLRLTPAYLCLATYDGGPLRGEIVIQKQTCVFKNG